MGEWDWVTVSNPRTLLDHVRNQVSERKRRLFACACCYLARHLMFEPSWHAVEMAERFADGQISSEELDRAADAANELWLEMDDVIRRRAGEAAFQCAVGTDEVWQLDYAWVDAALALEAEEIARTWTGPAYELTQHLDHWRVIVGELMEPAGWTDANPEAEMAHLLRCIFGNPFRPVSVDPSWLTSTVIAIAEGIYADRAFDRLPILADALEDAGCGHADLLAHCRGGGPHARGCWVVDLVLGKE